MGRTLAQKIWDSRVVHRADGEPDLLYIDLHLIHEVTSPQAFDGLRLAGRGVRRPDLTVATEDHNVPTLGVTGPGLPLIGPGSPVTDPVSRVQVETLRKNCAEFGVSLYPMGDAGQGIVHVISPQQGLTQPGMTIVCGDSHTSTHGALGALAFGIGTSEVEHVLATQTLPQQQPAQMAVNVTGALPYGVTAKDLILAVIAQIGTGGGVGHIIEYRGEAVRGLPMSGRLTVCNMSIEAGARAGLIAPDDTTFSYLEGRPHAPRGADWEAALDYWRSLPTDPGRHVRQGGDPGRGRAQAVRHLGHQPGPGGAAGLGRARPGRDGRPGGAGLGAARAELHGPGRGHPAHRHRGEHGVRRLLHQRPAGGPAGRGRRAARQEGGRRGPDAGRARAPCRSRWPPSRKAWTRCSPRPARSGGRRAAQCAWA